MSTGRPDHASGDDDVTASLDERTADLDDPARSEATDDIAWDIRPVVVRPDV